MIRKILFAILVLGVTAGLAGAAVEPVIVTLYSQFGQPDLRSYTVPTGKVLVVNAVNLVGTDKLILTPYPLDYVQEIEDPDWQDQVTSFARPLYIPERWKVQVDTPGAGTPAARNEARLFGVLADKEDIYASLEGEFESFRMAGGDLVGTLRLASARPVAVRFEGSDDLENWHPEDAARVLPTAQKGVYEYRIPYDGSAKRVYRGEAVPR